MANLKEIRNRISSVSSTMQITSAMKMVSAAKLKKAQDAIVAMRPYADKLSFLLAGLGQSLEEGTENVYAEKRAAKKVLLVAISSNRGLCGAFNTNIIKAVKAASESYGKGVSVEIVTIGKKVADGLKEAVIVGDHSSIYDDLTFDASAAVVNDLIEAFISEQYDEIRLVYNSFKNAATQIVKNEAFLPMVAEGGASETTTEEYIFEPSAEEIVNELIPKSLKIQLYKAIRDSFASEHGARMTAMHKATDNAKELRDQLKLTYNKARQAAITNEILEIVGGAEALNG
ncbi:MAG: ATP synthase F1 subunit gamma [Flavobacteriaceae bacterium]|nr:ATP synthase F1 subunit gamma [Flavobacteriaceae bacterium]